MEKLLVTVSGGRSSAYMAIRLHREYQHKFDMHFVYANTGQEHPMKNMLLIIVKDINKS